MKTSKIKMIPAKIPKFAEIGKNWQKTPNSPIVKYCTNKSLLIPWGSVISAKMCFGIDPTLN